MANDAQFLDEMQNLEAEIADIQFGEFPPLRHPNNIPDEHRGGRLFNNANPNGQPHNPRNALARGHQNVINQAAVQPINPLHNVPDNRQENENEPRVNNQNNMRNNHREGPMMNNGNVIEAQNALPPEHPNVLDNQQVAAQDNGNVIDVPMNQQDEPQVEVNGEQQANMNQANQQGRRRGRAAGRARANWRARRHALFVESSREYTSFIGSMVAAAREDAKKKQEEQRNFRFDKNRK